MTVSTPNGSLSAAGRLDRNRRIAEAREIEGLSWPVIGERFGLSERHARRAYEDFRVSVERGEVPEVDVEGAVARVVRVHLSALSKAEAMIDAVTDSNSGVGFLRVGPAVGASLLDVLSRTGLLPDARDEALRRRIRRGERELTEVFMAELERAGVPGEVLDRAVGLAAEAATAPAVEEVSA